MPVSYSRKAKELYQDAVLIEIPGAGHGFFGDDFETACPEIVNFIRENGRDKDDRQQPRR